MGAKDKEYREYAVTIARAVRQSGGICAVCGRDLWGYRGVKVWRRGRVLAPVCPDCRPFPFVDE